MRGFEPPTPYTPCKCASQAALHPDKREKWYNRSRFVVNKAPTKITVYHIRGIFSLMKYHPNTILPAQSKEAFITHCQELLLNLKETVAKEPLDKVVSKWQETSQHMRQLLSLARCLSAQDVNNQEAIKLMATCLALEAEFQIATESMDKRLAHEPAWPVEQPLIYPLEQRRLSALQKMSVEQEKLVAELSVHGFHSWNELYKIMTARFSLRVQEKEFSLSQIDNLLSHPDHEVRKEAFESLEKTLKEQELLFAHILRSITGFRLKLWQQRGWDSSLQEALARSRMQQNTLSSLWQAVEMNAPAFQEFYQQMRDLLSIEQICWHDLDAPLPGTHLEFSYTEASEIIQKSFSSFSKDMSSYSKRAFEQEWIEAEDRKGKAAGGFCTPLPLTKESRIFMTYSGTMHNLLVLAHELGHGYHNHVAFQLPEMAQLYPETLAETASTVAELFVFDGLLARAGTAQEKRAILYEKIKRSCLFFLNIHARFLFEKACFDECAKGFVSADRFCQLMIEAQKKAYGNTLSRYHPYFWISKLHFYLTEVSWYNFPYTCGYLLSHAICSKAKEHPMAFEAWYIAFLKDTGSHSIEEVIKKHFGSDATTLEFWNSSMQAAIQDIKLFKSFSLLCGDNLKDRSITSI